jgi:Tfp pilus assembly protein PilV
MMSAKILTTSAKGRGLRRGGFTLVEAALTTMIVGVGTVAMMGLLVTGVNSSQQAANLTTAVDLANDVHELCESLPFAASNNYWGIPSGYTVSSLMSSPLANITWLDGQTFGAGSTPAGPVDATFSTIAGLSGWSEVVAVNSVSPTNLAANAPTKSTATYPMSRITVTINHTANSTVQQVYQTSWIVAQ